MIKKLVQSGVLDSDSRIQQFTKVLTNSLSLLSIAINIPLFFLYATIGLKLSVIYLFLAAVFSIPIVLNHYGFYKTASLLNLTLNTLIILTSSILFGFDMEIHTLLIAITLCSSLLFLSFIHAFLFNLFISTLYVVCRIYSDAHGPIIESEVLEIREFLNFGVSLIATFVIARFILRSLLMYIDSLEATLKELKKNNQEIAKQNKQLELFNSIAAHDLRTPIRNMTSFTTLAKKTILENKSQEKTIGHLDMALQYSNRMNELVNSIANLNSIKRVESEEIVKINLCHHISRIKQQYKAQFKKQVDIKCKGDIFIYSKLSHWNIIFDNLLQNAIKYNEQEVVHININSTLENEVLSIFIIDNGIGINETYYETIFDPFSKLHRPEEYAGTGLGLYIIREILSLYDATISVSKNQDLGSTFKIQIPYKD